MKFGKTVILVAVLGLVAVACDDGAAELSTTSSLVTGTTVTPPNAETTTTANGGGDGSQTATTLVGERVGSYDVMVRVSGDDGETLFILIPPGAYTDVDLENFIGNLKEGDEDIWGVEVFDDAEAIEVFAIPEDQRTAEQQQLIVDHHFVSLVNGDTIRYQGPFEEFGEYVIGS
ncbi:MAG: hypothetical protein WBM90_02610 [Acidimicrobiia bacterium]